MVLQLTRISASQHTFFLDDPRESKLYSIWWGGGGWNGLHICTRVPEVVGCQKLKPQNIRFGMNLEALLQYFCTMKSKILKKDIFFAHSAKIVDGMWSEKAAISSIREIFCSLRTNLQSCKHSSFLF